MISITVDTHGPLEIDMEQLLRDTKEGLEEQRAVVVPVRSGALRQSLDITIETGSNGVRIVSDLPYAQIIDEGGEQPAIDLTGTSRVMVAFIDGEFRFFKRRRAVQVQGKHYINAMIDGMLSEIEPRFKEDV